LRRANLQAEQPLAVSKVAPLTLSRADAAGTGLEAVALDLGANANGRRRNVAMLGNLIGGSRRLRQIRLADAVDDVSPLWLATVERNVSLLSFTQNDRLPIAGATATSSAVTPARGTQARVSRPFEAVERRNKSLLAFALYCRRNAAGVTSATAPEPAPADTLLLMRGATEAMVQHMPPRLAVETVTALQTVYDFLSPVDAAAAELTVTNSFAGGDDPASPKASGSSVSVSPAKWASGTFAKSTAPSSPKSPAAPKAPAGKGPGKAKLPAPASPTKATGKPSLKMAALAATAFATPASPPAAPPSPSKAEEPEELADATGAAVVPLVDIVAAIFGRVEADTAARRLRSLADAWGLAEGPREAPKPTPPAPPPAEASPPVAEVAAPAK